MNPDVLEVVANGAASACGGCGAALAADQHYCLHCGAPQGAPRVPYRELIAPALTAPQGAAPAGPPPVANAASGVVAPPPGPARDWTAVIALGGLATLALVLVVGVLIGKSGSSTQPAAVAPQVITVSAPAAVAATTPAPATTGAGDATGAGKTAKHGGGAAKHTPKALKELQSTSGSDYQKKSSKLPTTVKLPGKPPAKDTKPAGGGSGAGETIG